MYALSISVLAFLLLSCTNYIFSLCLAVCSAKEVRATERNEEALNEIAHERSTEVLQQELNKMRLKLQYAEATALLRSSAAWTKEVCCWLAVSLRSRRVAAGLLCH